MVAGIEAATAPRWNRDGRMFSCARMKSFPVLRCSVSSETRRGEVRRTMTSGGQTFATPLFGLPGAVATRCAQT
jgi:hypothetical protein